MEFFAIKNKITMKARSTGDMSLLIPKGEKRLGFLDCGYSLSY
jgi:hypothetical protein